MVGIPVFMYHKVSPNRREGKAEKLRVTPEKFDRQMGYLFNHGYKTLTVEELMRFREGHLQLPGRNVIISFDDGYRDNFTYAFPILQKYNFTAIIFLVSGYIGSTSEWDEGGTEPLLSWEEIKEMWQGRVEFGSHSHTHRLLPSLSREEARREIARSKAVIEEKLGCPIDFFSYPWGKFNPEVKDMVKDCGYRAAFSTLSGRNGPREDILALRRVLIRGYDTGLHFFLNLKFGRARL